MSQQQFVTYYRVSTQRQGASGLGLDAQRVVVERYLSERAKTAVGEFCEVETGTPFRSNMPVPTYDKFIEPLLRFLATQPDGALARVAHEQAAAMLGLTEEEKQELLPSGTQPIYKNRAGWAHDRLKRAGLSSSPRRGYRHDESKFTGVATEEAGLAANFQ